MSRREDTPDQQYRELLCLLGMTGGDESVDTTTTTESVGGGRKDTVDLSEEVEFVEDEGLDLDFEDTTEDTGDVAQLSFDN